MSTLTTRVGGTRVTAVDPPDRPERDRGLMQVDAVDPDGTPVGLWTLPATTWLPLAAAGIAYARQRSTA